MSTSNRTESTLKKKIEPVDFFRSVGKRTSDSADGNHRCSWTFAVSQTSKDK